MHALAYFDEFFIHFRKNSQNAVFGLLLLSLSENYTTRLILMALLAI